MAVADLLKEVTKRVSTVANAGASASTLTGMSGATRWDFGRVASGAIGALQSQGGGAADVAALMNKLLGTKQNAQLEAMYELGQKALKGRSNLSAEELANLAKTERESAAYRELQAASRAKSSMSLMDVASIGAKGAVTGMVLGALTKAVFAATDLVIRVATLNFVKSNLRKSVTIAGSAKTFGMGIGGIATAVAGIKLFNAERTNARMSAAFEKAHSDGLHHANTNVGTSTATTTETPVVPVVATGATARDANAASNTATTPPAGNQPVGRVQNKGDSNFYAVAQRVVTQSKATAPVDPNAPKVNTTQQDIAQTRQASQAATAEAKAAIAKASGKTNPTPGVTKHTARPDAVAANASLNAAVAKRTNAAANLVTARAVRDVNNATQPDEKNIATAQLASAKAMSGMAKALISGGETAKLDHNTVANVDKVEQSKATAR